MNLRPICSPVHAHWGEWNRTIHLVLGNLWDLSGLCPTCIHSSSRAHRRLGQPYGLHRQTEVELEVELPASGHTVLIVVLVVTSGPSFQSSPSVSFEIGLGAILEFLEVCVIFEVIIESLAVW